MLSLQKHLFAECQAILVMLPHFPNPVNLFLVGMEGGICVWQISFGADKIRQNIFISNYPELKFSLLTKIPKIWKLIE